MTLKTPQFSIQDGTLENLDNSSKKNTNLDNLMTEQNIAIKKAKTVHRRRDLDSLG